MQSDVLMYREGLKVNVTQELNNKIKVIINIYIYPLWVTKGFEGI